VPGLRLRAHPTLPTALAISLLAGVCLSLAFPPAGFWPIAFVALIPLLWLILRASPGRAALIGAVYGIGFYGATLYWIYLFGFGAWTAVTLLSAASVALFAFIAPLLTRPGRPFVTTLAISALWTVIDWVRGMWPLGGFTWGSLGVSQVANRATLRVASVAGVWGVTFIVVAVNALLLAAIVGGGDARRRWLQAGLALALAIAPIVIPFPQAGGRTIDVATVQVDVRIARDAPTGVDEDLEVARLNIEGLSQLAGTHPDLAVLGEGAFDPGASSDPATVAALRSAVAAVGAPTLVGAVTDDALGIERTSVLLFDASGDLMGRYDKVHLVPFGEYVPWRSRLRWFKALQQIPVDRKPGEEVHALDAPGLPPMGTPICFENSFPSIPREMVRDGAGYLIVTVNNASYGFTAASRQHEQMSRMRAVEDGRWVVDAAVSGISSFIDPSGRVTQQLGLFRPGILRGTIRSSSSRTWFVRLGDWLPWLCLGFVVILFALPKRRPRSRPAPEALPEGFRTLVVLPTYDERATIERVIRGVLGAPNSVDVLVVDDSSPDGTADVVRALIGEFADRLRLLERPARSGLATAYLEGFSTAIAEGYDVAVEMDSDLSHDPAELPRLLNGASDHDLVVGSRYIPGGSVTNWSRSRVALSRAGNLYARIMLGVPLHDATSGFRAYRRDLLRDLTAEPFHADGYGFQIELVYRAWNLGYSLGEAPITFREREHGVSKISRRIVAEALWLVTKWGFKQRFRRPSGETPIMHIMQP
jgi:apolipoprotein N-acyltransferase